MAGPKEVVVGDNTCLIDEPEGKQREREFEGDLTLALKCTGED